MELTRKAAIQSLVDAKGYRNYLEIGVFLGHVFFFIRARNKVGVDPNVSWGFFKKLKPAIRYRNLSTLTARVYKCTSDSFFAGVAPRIYKRQGIDIAYVDGMHEYGYVLRDVEHTLRYLSKGGAIVLHNCNPATADAAVSFEQWEERGFTGNWNGDVWRAIVHLRSLREDVQVFVLDTDQGLGIITYGKPEKRLPFSTRDVRALTYEGLEANRAEWLNLKAPSYFYSHFNLPDPGRT